VVLNCSGKGLLVLLSVIINASRAVLLDIFSGNFKKIQKLEGLETVHKHLEVHDTSANCRLVFAF